MVTTKGVQQYLNNVAGSHKWCWINAPSVRKYECQYCVYQVVLLHDTVCTVREKKAILASWMEHRAAALGSRGANPVTGRAVYLFFEV